MNDTLTDRTTRPLPRLLDKAIIQQLQPDDETPQSPADFVQANPWLFKTVDSYRWFLRGNKDELIAAGALIRPVGRDLILPGAFKRAAIAIGARRAGQSA